MDKQFALRYDQLEQEHWWFRGRRAILKSLLNAHIPWQNIDRVVEVGTSSGTNLYHLYPSDVELLGIEPFAPNLEIARSKGKVPVMQGTAEEFPDAVDEKLFDLITMFDVLEHTEDDRLVLDRMHDRLTDEGYLAITVPAYMWMWGQQDVVSHHYRRYTMTELVGKLREAGFTICHHTYFNTFLFPPIGLIRLLSRLLPEKEADEFGDFQQGGSALNTLLTRVFGAERHLLRFLKFPFGVSAFAVARKN